MRLASLLRVVALAAGTSASVSVAGAQTPTAISLTPITLKSFTPVDSLIANSQATSFTIQLVNVVSGTPSDYRVSRFADFRDASWIPYGTTPSTVIQRTWFPPLVSGRTQLTLYFQVRAKNPKAGQPISSIGGQTTVQPTHFLSEVLGRRIRLVYFG